MINKFFDIVFCLTQKRRVDRWQMFCEEMEKHNFNADPFYAIECKDAKISFCMSQLEMLKVFLQTDGETLLTLEDDVLFKGLDKLPDVMKQLPTDWKLFYLGANAKPYAEFRPAEPFSKDLRIIRSGYCTHAVAYRRELVQEIVDSYEYIEGEMYDAWLDRVILPNHDCYVAAPLLAWQKGVRSDLWDRPVDYYETWMASNDYLLNV
jgi:hypothetical protein